MTKLEEKIIQNRELFDSAEPSAEHFEKFSRKLTRLNKPPKHLLKKSILLKVAAIIIILLGISVVINYFALDNKGFLFTSRSQAEVPQELRDVEMYYTGLASDKLNQIDKLAEKTENPEKIKEMATNELRVMNATNNALQVEYIKSGRNERVFDAIVNNYRIISNLLDHIIQDLNKKQNTQSTENKIS